MQQPVHWLARTYGRWVWRGVVCGTVMEAVIQALSIFGFTNSNPHIGIGFVVFGTIYSGYGAARDVFFLPPSAGVDTEVHTSWRSPSQLAIRGAFMCLMLAATWEFLAYILTRLSAVNYASIRWWTLVFMIFIFLAAMTDVTHGNRGRR